MADLEPKRTLVKDDFASEDDFIDRLFQHKKLYPGVFFSITEARHLYHFWFWKRCKDSPDDQVDFEKFKKPDYLCLRKLIEQQLTDDLVNPLQSNPPRNFSLIFSGTSRGLLFQNQGDSLAVFSEPDPEGSSQQVIKFERSRGLPMMTDKAIEICSLYPDGSVRMIYNHRPENTGAIFTYRSNWPQFRVNPDGTSVDARDNLKLITQDIRDITHWYLLGKKSPEIS